MKYFYVYYSYEEYGRGYIGKRECDCLPEHDINYLGSFKDKTFKPTQKIILETFNKVEDALNAECILHNFYEVDKNPHFANKAKQTSKKFYFSYPEGYKRIISPETKRKISESMRGDNNPAKNPEVRKKLKEARNKRIITNETKEKMSNSHKGKDGTYGMLGKKHSDETKKKMRESAVKRINKEYSLVNPNGEKFTFNNISEFSKENNLIPSLITLVLNNKRSHHKGWTRA